MKFLKKIITITVFSIVTLSSCQDYNNNITTAMTNKKSFRMPQRQVPQKVMV